ncbi:DUF7662 domain-containing protein [Caldanaerobacter subterraneus]|uniref:DUF7662 domain-containing protein n=1 Tax=Caldanaerobacter subterraneus TaxID=911092 RepID=UPI003B9680AF
MRRGGKSASNGTKLNKGKYYPLEEYLMNQDSSRIKLSFEDIEKIIGDILPLSASKHCA